MSKQIRISNVPINDLRYLLSSLADHYELVDIIVDPENKRVILDPVDHTVVYDPELTDENIYNII